MVRVRIQEELYVVSKENSQYNKSNPTKGHCPGKQENDVVFPCFGHGYRQSRLVEGRHQTIQLLDFEEYEAKAKGTDENSKCVPP